MSSLWASLASFPLSCHVPLPQLTKLLCLNWIFPFFQLTFHFDRAASVFCWCVGPTLRSWHVFIMMRQVNHFQFPISCTYFLSPFPPHASQSSVRLWCLFLRFELGFHITQDFFSAQRQISRCVNENPMYLPRQLMSQIVKSE